jgi:peptidoglycan hydrolase CwlO-like protein
MEVNGSDTMALVGVLITLGTLVTIVQKILKNLKKAKAERDAQILQAAKEEAAAMKMQLESKIEKLDQKLKNVESSVRQDIGHLRDLHENEIKALGEKIESLRDELKTQHVQLMNILAKLIDDRK